MKRIEGDQEVAENGARQTNVPYQMELIDPYAILTLGAVLKKGADKYGVDNWRGIPSDEHLGRAIQHLYLHKYGDISEPHLANAFTRCMMALATQHAEVLMRVREGDQRDARGTVRSQAG